MTGKLPEQALKKIISLRKTLHKYPEVSGNEKQTARRLKTFLEKLKPDSLYTGLAGHGLLAMFDSGKEGPALLLRADIDALPIQEVNDFDYRSGNDGVSHKCGHDGHTAIMAGVATLLSGQRPKKGKALLLFQPEEETGQGAEKILKEKVFETHVPDMAFALHNLPGYRKKAVVLREGPFAAASKGMIIELKGHSSHAAHPEQGNSPVKMMGALMGQLMEIPEQDKKDFNDFTLLTIIHARLGEVAFGTNPGKATVMATLRTFYDKDMDILTRKAEALANKLAKDFSIKTEISYTEVFPATINDAKTLAIVKKAAEAENYHIIEKEAPFRWSEDFGHFTGKYPGVLFGVGSGENHPSLHNHDYDFPDEIIPVGVNVFSNIIDQVLNS